MSFNHIAWAWQTPLSWKEKYVLLALADYADANGKCFPSITTIASKIGLSAKNRNTVRRALEGLQDKGYINTSAQFHGKGQQTSNVYTLNLGFLHKPLESVGGPESTRGPERTPHKDEPPVRQGGAVWTGGPERTGVGPESTTNQSYNPSSLTTEEVLRTRESEDLDDLEALMVEEREVCSPNLVSDSAGSHKVPGGEKFLAGSGEQRSPRPTVDDFLAAMAEREAS